ncbi:CFI-box-CTERM domain-containing protein [Massilia sp. CMS3.1]|uniref:CFI-box-CTERM domain-containing protein n=1 Tax=Massilia sp. CMS3.1 TaxID=3373083 RepID=UPI003EE5BBDD
MNQDQFDGCAPRKGGLRTGDGRQSGKKVNAVGASELAQMGVCERLVVFEHHFGKRRSLRQRGAIKRGQIAHKQFYRDGASISGAGSASAEKGRCYIATLIFGAGPETAALRAFRDRVLRPYSAGRWCIGMHYRTAPLMCSALKHHAWLQPIVRTTLRAAVWLVKKILLENGENHGK